MPVFSIDVEARIAKAADSMNRLTHQVESNAKRMEGAFALAGRAVAVLGGALSAGAFAHLIKSTVDAADHLNDLSKRTGIAVETLAGLGLSAKQSGTDIDGVAAAAGKLNLSIASAAAGGKETQQAFAAMGLSVRDATGQIKTADVVLSEVADKFAGYADGPNKAAIAQKLFGKSYADMLPLLDEGGAKLRQNQAYAEKYGGITKDLAEQSDRFNDELAKTSVHVGSLGTALTSRLIGPLNLAIAAFNEFLEKTGVLQTIGEGIAEAFKAIVVVGVNVSYVFTQIGKDIAGVALIIDALRHLDPKKAGAIFAEMQAQAKQARLDVEALSAKLLKVPDAAKSAKAVKKPDAPGLPDTAAADKALADSAALAKKLLDQRLRDAEAGVARESDLLQSRNEAFAAYYQANYLSVEHFYALEQTAREEALNAKRAQFAKEKEFLFHAIENTTLPDKDRIEARTKLNDVIERQAKLENESAKASTAASFQMQIDQQAVHDTINAVNVALLENQGLTADAAKLQNDLATAAERTRLALNAPAANVAQFDQVQATKDAHNRYIEQIAVSDKRLRELGRTERDINDQAANGQLTTLQAMERTDDARRAAIEDLQREIPLLEERARLSNLDVDIESVKEAKQQLEDLAASAHSVQDATRHMFEDAFIDPLEDIITHAKSADDALKSFFQNIASSLLHIASRNIAQTLFGGLLGGGSGAGGLFSLFSGGAGAGAGASGTAVSSFGLYAKADGGIIGPRGEVPLHKYASGGIATRPQLALFGEGRLPEAYVPLPDGRRIPVQMKGMDTGNLVPVTRSLELGQVRAEQRTQKGGAPAVTLQLHPDAMRMTLSDWFQGELARTMATR